MSTLNHLWTRWRRELVRRAGFGLEKIVEFDAPKEWPSTGFQLGRVLLTRGYGGRASWSRSQARPLRSSLTPRQPKPDKEIARQV